MLIRPMRMFDAEKVATIYVKSWQAAYAGFVPQDYLNALCPERWTPFLLERYQMTLVLIDEEIYAGTISFGKARDAQMQDYGEIGSVYLLQEYWGKGYGTKLLQAALEKLGEMAFKDYYLWVLEENVRARRCYEKNGFIASNDRMICNIGGKELCEIRYVFHQQMR